MPMQILAGIISQNVGLERSFSEFSFAAQNVSGTNNTQEKEPW